MSDETEYVTYYIFEHVFCNWIHFKSNLPNTVSQSERQSVSQTVRESVSQSEGQSVSQRLSQSVRGSVRLSVRHSASP